MYRQSVHEAFGNKWLTSKPPMGENTNAITEPCNLGPGMVANIPMKDATTTGFLNTWVQWGAPPTLI